MQMPEELKSLIEKYLEIIRQNPLDGLKPIERIQIYNAFGPTFAPAAFRDRLDHICAGNFTLTTADYARAWTAILTAKHLLHLWEKAWKKWEEDGGDDGEETYEAEEGQEPGVYQVSTRKLPYYLLELAEGVLTGRVAVEKAWQEVNDTHYIVGNILEYSGEDYPIIAGMVCGAALEALYQSCGSEAFTGQQIDATTTDMDLEFQDAAASPAVGAWCIKLDETENFVFQKRKQASFWKAWLEKIIPAAWEMVDEERTSRNPPAEVAPYMQTVHVGVIVVGTVTIEGT